LDPFARAAHLAESGRRLPELFSVFFEGKGGLRRRSLAQALSGSEDSVIAWRNRVFGHGVFSQDRAWYARQTLERLETLHRFYEALRPILAGWALVSITPGGEELLWQGTEGLPPAPYHAHEPDGEPLPMLFAPRTADRGAPLPLGPLLSVQTCISCGQPVAFFFDRHRYERERDRHRSFFLENLGGHSREQRDWDEARRLAALLPSTFTWGRGSYDSEEVEEGVGVVFRDFDSGYLRPDYLMDAVWSIAGEQRKGYIEVSGPGGAGKTYFVRGLEREGVKRGAPVLAYYILPGALTDYRTFLVELTERARETLRFRTQEAQSRVAGLSDLQEQFTEFLGELMHANRLDTLVVAIDALDALPEPEPGLAAITDFLPPPEKLPDGCFVMLTSRRQLRPRIRLAIERLRLGSRPPAGKDGAPVQEVFRPIELSSEAPANRELLRAYLSARLPAQFRRPEHVEEVLKRSGGVFLYAYHLCRALESGAFADLVALPAGEQFYAAYLARLRERVGDHLYETVYLPVLLFLSAAQVPVTLEQLSRWGVPRERLQYALLDLRDFLRGHRVRLRQESLALDNGDNRYELAHDAFVRFVEGDAWLAADLLEGTRRNREGRADGASRALGSNRGDGRGRSL
jgi:hypothetical protein